MYSTFLGGSGFDYGTDIALDSAGNAYVSGLTYSIDFPVRGTVIESSTPFFLSGWLSKLDPSGAFIFSTYVGNESSQAAQRVALDASNNVYVAGWANLPTTYLTVSPVQTTPAPAGIVLRSTDNGATFHNSGFALNVGSTGGHDIVVDPTTSSGILSMSEPFAADYL
jgi:hypothetical protein